ncbi:MAG: type II toxin-antitoxin system RelE/ParE family toxin [Clostridiales bacterium]|nr:type II toxin-antitoxin system RelE/ParE family toxin [Clostridiales bacterium]
MSEKYKVVYSSAALDDLDAIYSYIAHGLKERTTARNQVNRIRKEIRSLDVFPGRYAKVDWEPWASAGMHRVPVNNFVVYYLVDTKSMLVTIIRIFYGGRDVENMISSETQTTEAQAAVFVNEALDEVDADDQSVEGHAFFDSMRKKYD